MARLHLHAPPGLFRLALALTVFVHHLSRLAIGSAAVYLFFILSGYWVSRMWSHKYIRSLHPYLTFIVSRLWRVLPVFIFCSALSWLLLYFGHRETHSTDAVWHQVLSNVSMLGYRSLSLQANVPAWSLDIEAQFYLMAPLIIASLARSLWFAVVYAAAAAVAAICGDAISIVPYIVFFVMGITASIGRWKPSGTLAIASLGATGLVLAGLILSPWRGVLLAGTHANTDYGFNPIACTILAFIMAPFALYTTSQRTSRTDVLYGDLSFIIYLMHFPVLDFIGTGGGSYVARLAATAEVLALILAGSLVVHFLIDRPMNKRRAQWVNDRVVWAKASP